MTQPPDRDRDLVDFLRQNRPEVPQGASDLEEVIFQKINMTSTDKYLSFKASKKQAIVKYVRRLIPSVMTAALAMAVIVNNLKSTEFVDVEVAQLEEFIEQNWYATLGNTDESELLF